MILLEKLHTILGLILNIIESTRKFEMCYNTKNNLMILILLQEYIICGHVFNHDALLRWFEMDTRCPICRYDLSTGRSRINNTTNTFSQTSTDVSNNDTESSSVSWRNHNFTFK